MKNKLKVKEKTEQRTEIAQRLGLEMFKVGEVAIGLNVSEPFLYKLIKTGRLPSIQIPSPDTGRRQKPVIRVLKSDLLKFIKENHRGPK